LQRELPGQQASADRWYGREPRGYKVVRGNRSERFIGSPFGYQVKYKTDYEQGNREMNDGHVLRMFLQEGSFYVERMHRDFPY
jgi:hypothetical protein